MSTALRIYPDDVAAFVGALQSALFAAGQTTTVETSAGRCWTRIDLDVGGQGGRSGWAMIDVNGDVYRIKQYGVPNLDKKLGHVAYLATTRWYFHAGVGLVRR